MFAWLVAYFLSAPTHLEHRALAVLGTDGRPVATATPLSKRLLVTNHHVVDDGETVVVQCGDDVLPGMVLGVSKTDDLALIALSRECASAVPSELGDELDLGERVWVVGFPLREFAVKSGIVTRYRQIRNSENNALRAGLTDGQVLPGNSGGPVLDSAGRLVGIAVGRLCVQLADGASCEGAFIPAETIRAFLSASRKRATMNAGNEKVP